MKAIVHEQFGPPEVLYIKEMEKPVPGDNEVLIRIHAAAVASEDPLIRSAPGFNGFRKPRRTILGCCLAGIVENTGKHVKKFRKGDHVYSYTFPWLHGAYAEYLCVPEKGVLAKKPVNMTYEEAAAVPDGALTALPFLRDRGKICQGQRVLIYGASGAVGSAGVQLASYLGAEVTGICSTANLEMVRELGACRVIDYTREDFTRRSEKYDVVFDAVGKSSFIKCLDILTDMGIYLTVMPKPQEYMHMLRTVITRGRKIRGMAAGLRSAVKKTRDLNVIKGIIEDGKFKAVIDRIYPMEQVVDAHQYVEQGHKKGNVVITIG